MSRLRSDIDSDEYADVEIPSNNYPFLQNLSHEVRTPMNAIVGISDLLLSKTTDVSQKEEIVSLKAATQNLLMVINNVIDYDQMREGTLTLHREVTNLEHLVSDVIEMARINIGDRDVLFVVELNPQLPEKIMIDLTRVKQALVYFLTNAAKCTKWGYIALVVDYPEGRKDCIRFMVENTELGLPIMKELIKYLGSELRSEKNDSGGLNMYFDVKLELPEGESINRLIKPDDAYYGICVKNERERLAFALYFSKSDIKYVEIDNPTELFILKENERPDYLILEYDRYRKLKDIKEFAELGTKLICLSDYYETDDVDPSALVIKRPFFYPEFRNLLNNVSGSSVSEQLIFDGARVLVVDDNAINLKVTAGLLKKYNLSVDTATGGEEAIRMIHRTRYDMVFMDHMMPGMDGTEATVIIRQAQDEYFKNLPIIALSANVLEDSRKLFERSEMNDFLSKPIDIPRLEEMLKKWIPASKQKTALKSMDSEDYDLTDLTALNLKHISPAKGISYTGGNIKMYLSILKDFKGSVADKKTLLTNLVTKDDVGRYTIEVHALKSLSATIGAKELSFLAADLEKKGHRRDMEAIVEEHQKLIDELDRVESEISLIVTASKPKEKKMPLLREKAGEVLRDLFHAMEDFDYDRAEKTIADLDKYEYDSLVQESFEKLKECVDRIDYEATGKQAIEMLALL